MSRDSGFSLVELLVSLAILGLLSLMLLQGVFSGRRVWERLDSRAVRLETVEDAQSALRDRLERAFPLTRYDASAPFADFQGEAKVVRFLAPPPLSARPAALRRYTLGLTTSGDLVLTSASDVALDAARASEQTVLLRNVRSVDFTYWGVAPPDNVERWRPTWRARPTTPQLVRIRLAFQPGDRRVWPELIVRPAANVGSACVVDATTGACRGLG